MPTLRSKMELKFFLALAVMASGCIDAHSEPASTPVKVGVLAIRAGAGAQVGQAGQRATEWWAKRVNAAGGILGRPIQLFVEEESTPQDTVARFRKLVLQGKVNVVLGVTSTAVGLALAPVAEEMGVPLLMWDATTQSGITETLPDPRWVFRSTDNETEAIAAAILTARTFPGVRKVAGINNDYSYGRDNWQAYQAALRRLLPGVQFTEGIFTKLGETEFSSHIASIQRSGADLLMSSFWTNDAPVFLKQAAAVGLFDGMKGVFATAGDVTDALKKEFTPEGLIVGYNSMYFADSHASGLLQEFVEDFKASGGYPSFEADHAYFVAEAWKKAVEKAGPSGSWPALEKVVEALEGIEVESLSGMRRMSEDHRMEARFFQGIATHDNPYDFVTIDPVEIFPTDRVMKPTATTPLLDWISAWQMAPDGLPVAAGRS